MPEAPISLLYSKPTNQPKQKPRMYRGVCTMQQFKELSHKAQMRLDSELSESLTHELRPDHDFGKPYWVSKKPSK